MAVRARDRRALHRDRATRDTGDDIAAIAASPMLEDLASEFAIERLRQWPYGHASA
jgi:hypothetical protein